MVQLQILSKVLQTRDDSIITDNLLTEDHFSEYREEFKFIEEHKDKYGNVPDKETFLAHFPTIELFDVFESDKYLIETIKEEYLYSVSVPVLQEFERLLRVDSNAANEYLESQKHVLQPNYYIGGTDIIAQASDRLTEHIERKENQKKWYFETGFPELDEVIHGLQRGEEFLVIFARTGVGKSWMLAKICAHVWKTGFNVGYISPEMSANKVGFRFDTVLRNFSNKGLLYGNGDLDEDKYREHIEELTKNNKNHPFIVSTPIDFDRKVTVSRIRNWVKQNKLDMIAIDGISYLSDERGRKGDNKTTSLTNISEDLMELSVEMGIPVVAVVQVNRTGVIGADEDGTPELDSIRDSDGIVYNASKAIALGQKMNGVFEMGVKKHRDGEFNVNLHYSCDINTGVWTFLDSDRGRTGRRKSSGDNNVSVGKPKKSNTDVF